MQLAQKNYETYANIKKLEEHTGAEDQDEEEEDADEKKGHDFQFLKKIKVEHGRSGGDAL